MQAKSSHILNDTLRNKSCKWMWAQMQARSSHIVNNILRNKSSRWTWAEMSRNEGWMKSYIK